MFCMTELEQNYHRSEQRELLLKEARIQAHFGALEVGAGDFFSAVGMDVPPTETDEDKAE